MLFNGEAIFGVVDFNGDAGASARRAESMVEQADRLGTKARCEAMGSVILGFVGAASSPKDADMSEKQNVFAVGVGECLDRERRQSLHCSEPERSRFLASGYEATGVSFLPRLDGTFAAAFWNEREQELLLACDRRADAQLYYRIDDNQLVFSSWLRLFDAASLAIDRQAVTEFLRFLYIAAPRTIYQGVNRLEGGRYATVSQGRLELHELATHTDRKSGIVSDNGNSRVLAEFEERFEEAIRRRIGQRHAGVLLSSGIDSATLTAGCQRINPGKVQAFTVGFDNVELDETSAASALARQIGVPHTELRFDLSQYASAFGRMARGFDQPFADPASLPLVLACEAAKDRADVICDGTGSDGLFGAAIPRHLRFSLQVSAKLPLGLRRSLSAAVKQVGSSNLSRYSALLDFDEPEELFITWAGWSKKELAELLGHAVSLEECGFYRLFRAHRGAGSQQLYDAIGILPPDDSRLEAAGLVHTPIELPYHDVDLAIYVRNLPEKFRMSTCESKILLRQLFDRYFPVEPPPARKHYFNIPLQQLMARRNFEMVNEYLAPRNMQRRGLVDSERAWSWISRFIAGEDRLRFKIWALLVLHAWDAR